MQVVCETEETLFPYIHTQESRNYFTLANLGGELHVALIKYSLFGFV